MTNRDCQVQARPRDRLIRAAFLIMFAIGVPISGCDRGSPDDDSPPGEESSGQEQSHSSGETPTDVRAPLRPVHPVEAAMAPYLLHVAAMADSLEGGEPAEARVERFVSYFEANRGPVTESATDLGDALAEAEDRERWEDELSAAPDVMRLITEIERLGREASPDELDGVGDVLKALDEATDRSQPR